MQFEFFQTHPLIANVLKFVLMAAGAAAVVILLLRFEKKAARRFLPGRTNINVRFAERRMVICVFTVMMSIMEAYGFGAASGYSIINDAIKTLDDAVNEATLDMKNNKEDIEY